MGWKAQSLKTQDAFTKRWLQRHNTLFRRGNTTGKVIRTFGDLDSLPRLKLCSLFNDKKLFDLKISKISEASSLSAKEIEAWLKNKSLYGEQVSENYFGKYRYYPDIPGNTLAWGTLRKYRKGCLVFKPESDRSLSYYKLIHPWKHFIPVSSDFSDLKEKLMWANQNEEKSAQIAYQGYSFSNRYIASLDTYFMKRFNSMRKMHRPNKTQSIFLSIERNT